MASKKHAAPFAISAFVLAGGQSSRMGRDKALLEWHGRPLIEHALEKLRVLGAEFQGTQPRILGARPDLKSFAPVVEDNFPGHGPLGGIEAALSIADTDLSLFLPIDLPFLPAEFLRWMVGRAALTGAAATIPRMEGRPQPLCALYHRRLLPGIRSALRQGDGKVTRVIANSASDAEMRIDSFDVESIATAQAHAGTWPLGTPVHRWFENMNTPSDFMRAALEQTPYIY